MNPRIQKLEAEIERARARIAENQAKLRDLERQKTELENTEYVALIRNLNLSPQELMTFIKAKGKTVTSHQTIPEPDYIAQEEDSYEK